MYHAREHANPVAAAGRPVPLACSPAPPPRRPPPLVVCASLLLLNCSPTLSDSATDNVRSKSLLYVGKENRARLKYVCDGMVLVCGKCLSLETTNGAQPVFGYLEKWCTATVLWHTVLSLMSNYRITYNASTVLSNRQKDHARVWNELLRQTLPQTNMAKSVCQRSPQ